MRLSQFRERAHPTVAYELTLLPLSCPSAYSARKMNAQTRRSRHANKLRIKIEHALVGRAGGKVQRVCKIEPA